MEPNKQLQIAYDFVNFTGENIFLTGKAGTGKTTFLKKLKKSSSKRMIVVAPTGVAAINAGGVTIHSFFQLSFGPQVPGQKKEYFRFSKTKTDIIRSIDLLVIDEISMVRADLLDAIDRVLRRIRDNNLPFGGVQLLMIGDLQQLAPVVKSEDWNLLKQVYDTFYFFGSKALKKSSYISIELTHVYRQQDDRFIRMLNKVRVNQLDGEAAALLNQRYIPDFTPGEDDDYITLCTHNQQAKEINSEKIKNLPGRSRTFTAVVEGKFPEYSYPTDSVLKLKKGSQVIFIKNDPDPEKRFYNGKTGRISRIIDETVFVKCPGNQEEIEISSLTWENIKYSVDEKTAEITETTEGTFTQIPLKLAWAITIHKSQGLTFEKVVIDAEASFAHGQVYVALSRCKTLEGMVLTTPFSSRSIVRDRKVDAFIKNVENSQPGEEELIAARQSYQRDILFEVFDFERIKYVTYDILELGRRQKEALPKGIIKQLDRIYSAVCNDLDNVAEKFRKQMSQLLNVQKDVGKNAGLIERIKKASAYFEQEVKKLLVEELSEVDLDVDNTALKKQFKTRMQKLNQETSIKLAVFEICREGFDLKNILEAKAKANVEKRKSRKPDKYREASSDPEIHKDLYGRLKAWRYEKAKELGIPVYMVFSQKSLVELASFLPVEKAELMKIKGIGKKKATEYGPEIVDIIRTYCEECEVKKEIS